MNVQVSTGTVPEGLTLGPAQIDPPVVNVRGASTRVAAIRAIVARVAVDASGLSVDREVELVALDEQGNLITNVDIEPPRARVRIAVAQQLDNRTLPVVPQFVGSLPSGLRIASVEVAPVVVTVSGEKSIVTTLDSASTEPIDLDERMRDFEIDVPLALPAGLTVSGRGDVRVAVTIVEDTASRTYAVGVTPTGTRADLAYDLASAQVSVTLGGRVTALDTVDASQMVANVDVSGLAPGRHVLALEFSSPPGLELVSMSPSTVVVVVREQLPPVGRGAGQVGFRSAWPG